MKQVSGKELIRIVERRGWFLKRVQGSHHIYGKAGEAALLVIPLHRNEPLKTGLLRSLMKLAALTEGDL